MTKQQMAIELIEQCEGCKLEAYLDSRGIPTIGIGTIYYPAGKHVKLGDICTLEQAQEWLNHHLEHYVYSVVDTVANDAPDRVWAALCSLDYNIGSALHGQSVLLALRHKNWTELATAFRKYNKQRNEHDELVFCQGLANRREIEIKFFMEGLK